jgi:hypothetical protein
MVTNDSKEQTKGDFRCKLRDADCHPRVTKPYSPWQQATEGCIHKLKHGSTHKMLKTGSPKTLWDHCLELEALVCSNTSNDIYMTNGQVPETIMKGTTANISHIAEFGWYDWVMFRDNVPTYPNDKVVLGHYLGPAINMGSALTAKILKDNGQFVCCSTLRHLTQQELNCSVHTATRLCFDESVKTHLGPSATAADFPAEDITPDLDHFDDSKLLSPDADDVEVTPEFGDNLLNAKIMLPCGGVLTKGRVTARKCDNAGNPVGLADSNPILDTRSYIVDFADGNQAMLSANSIAKSLYSQCDPESHPVETAEYAKIVGIDHEAAFNWWVPTVISKQDYFPCETEKDTVP